MSDECEPFEYEPVYAEIGIEQYGADEGATDTYLQADGGDIVYIEQNGDGTARVVVYDSNHPEGNIIFEGGVRVDGKKVTQNV